MVNARDTDEEIAQKMEAELREATRQAWEQSHRERPQRYNPSLDMDTTARPISSARQVIAQRIERLRREAHGLERLLDALPAVLPNEADAALIALLRER
ncbi:MAG TPA: hypothetical protein VIV12_17150 [Streptosporangiaceae bacterium]